MLEKIIDIIYGDNEHKAVNTFNKIFTDSGVIEFKLHAHVVDCLAEVEALELDYNCECEEKAELRPRTFDCLLIATVHEEEQTIDVTDFSTWAMWAEAVIHNFFTTADDAENLLEYYAKKLKL